MVLYLPDLGKMKGLKDPILLIYMCTSVNRKVWSFLPCSFPGIKRWMGGTIIILGQVTGVH